MQFVAKVGKVTNRLLFANSREGWPCCRCGVLAVTVVRSAGAGLYIAPVRVMPTLETFSEAVQNARTFRHNGVLIKGPYKAIGTKLP